MQGKKTCTAVPYLSALQFEVGFGKLSSGHEVRIAVAAESKNKEVQLGYWSAWVALVRWGVGGGGGGGGEEEGRGWGRRA